MSAALGGVMPAGASTPAIAALIPGLGAAMSDPTEELMLRWEEARQKGRDLPPEALCADCPDRTEEIRRRIVSILAMEKLLGVTGHDPNATMLSMNGAAPAEAPEDMLPTIPGY